MDELKKAKAKIQVLTGIVNQLLGESIELHTQLLAQQQPQEIPEKTKEETSE